MSTLRFGCQPVAIAVQIRCAWHAIALLLMQKPTTYLLMKNFTLIALALLAVSTSASAQRFFRHNALHGNYISSDPRIMKEEVSRPDKKLAPMRKALSLPTTEQTYLYEDGEWVEDASYAYTYDAKGNILTMIEEYDGEQTKTAYEYNENGKQTLETTLIGDGNGGFENSTMLTQAYDEKVPSLVVSSLEYTWNDPDWTMISAGRTWKRDVNRNSAGNVLGVGLNSYYNGDFELIQQTTLEYGDDAKPATWKKEELSYTGNDEYAMEEAYNLSEMTWHATDGQVVTMDLEGFHTGNNLLSHAIVTEPEYGQTGIIDATYTDDGGYVVTYSYTEPLGKDVMTLTYDDANGSYTLTTNYYEDVDEDGVIDDEPQESTLVTVVYDEHGNMTQEDSYLDDEHDSGIKYEYTYREGSDYPQQQIYSEYNPETDEYEPFMKIVSGDYTDVTDCINTLDNAPESAEMAFYGVDGAKVGKSLSGAKKGVYIAKMGKKAVKLIKK